MKTLLICCCCCMLFGLLKSKAQGNFTLLFEPELSFGYNLSPNYAQSFNIENRNFFYGNTDFYYDVRHLEIAHTSELSLNDTQSIALGIQYRFAENFDTLKENEFRLVQDYSWKQKKSRFNVAQTLKTEQRFYKSTTKYRVRYEIGAKFSFGKNSNYLRAETETLLQLAKIQKPEFEQRLSGVFGWQLQSITTFEIGLQYRLSDYAQNLSHELFFTTRFDISL